ncbi:MAG: substrate-binding domain-containing protein [Butyrivibrio sp.]|nr:substrate-binding domain-containing protein [Butyrivibrio sp.]
MKIKKKNLFILTLSVLLVVLITISGFAVVLSGMERDPYNISVIVSESQDSRWNMFFAGIEQASQDYKVKINTVSVPVSIAMNDEFVLINDEVNGGADGMIVEFSNCIGTSDFIGQLSTQTVLELVETRADADVDVEGKYAFIGADDNELGAALANEIRLKFGNSLSGKKIGIITGSQKQYSTMMRREGFMSAIETTGASIVWEISGIYNAEELIMYKQRSENADIVVAFTDSGLEKISEFASKYSDDVYIVGVGTSIQNVSFVDDGVIGSMVVPNEYYMGYRSVAAICEKLENKLSPMSDEIVSYKIVNKENLFDEANQRMLFPVIE